MRWLNENGRALQAGAALVSALVGLIALFAIGWQVNAAGNLAREQSARDIYREFLNLSIQNPQFSDPDYCALEASDKASAYGDYVSYMLYTADQVLSVDREWQPAIDDLLEAHEAAICTIKDGDDYSAPVARSIADFRLDHCAKLLPCS